MKYLLLLIVILSVVCNPVDYEDTSLKRKAKVLITVNNSKEYLLNLGIKNLKDFLNKNENWIKHFRVKSDYEYQGWVQKLKITRVNDNVNVYFEGVGCNDGSKLLCMNQNFKCKNILWKKVSKDLPKNIVNSDIYISIDW